MTKYIPYILVAVLFIGYIFVAFNRTNKQRKAFEQLQEKLKVGNKIIFSNGLRGEVIKLTDTTMMVKCGSTTLEAERACVQMIVE